MDQKRVLVVDDERDLCDILLFNLRAAGYQADAAYSAEEALNPAYQYNLLLLDVMMPGMSGFELAKHLKEDEKTRHIPIIFLTAKDTESDTLHGFSLGADDYVTKPFSVREVMARVKAVLNRSKSIVDEPTVYEGSSSMSPIRRSVSTVTLSPSHERNTNYCCCSWSIVDRCSPVNNCSTRYGGRMSSSLSGRWM